MEAWLSELEMEWNQVQDPILINNDVQMHYHHQQEGVDTFDEQLALVLGEDFPYSLSAESTISSQILPESSSTNPTGICRSVSVNQLSALAHDNVPTDNKKNSNNDHSLNSATPETPTCEQQHDQMVSDHQENNSTSSDKDSKKQAPSARQKRKREPSQVHDHIMAERKRRELLTQRFIALSAIVPGLKKVDKTSVLGETIKYLQQLKEKVKVLEETTAKQTVKSVVVIKRTQLVLDSDSSDDNGSTCSIDDNSPSGGGDGTISISLPEIEVKLSDKTILIRIHCEKQKGILAKIFAEVEKHDMSVVNSSIMPFGSLALDITVVAQMEKECKKHVKELIKILHTALQAPSGHI